MAIFKSFSSLNTTNGMLIRTSYRWMLTRTFAIVSFRPTLHATIVTVL